MKKLITLLLLIVSAIICAQSPVYDDLDVYGGITGRKDAFITDSLRTPKVNTDTVVFPDGTKQTTAYTPGVGTGDMQKAIYDTDLDNIVDNSELLNNQNGAYYLNSSNHTGTQAISTVAGLQDSLNNKINENSIINADSLGGLPANSYLLKWDSTIYVTPYYLSQNVDGSETVVTAGANVTVTGTGTSGDPYVVNSTAAGGDSNFVTVTAEKGTFDSLQTTIPDTRVLFSDNGLISSYSGFNMLSGTRPYSSEGYSLAGGSRIYFDLNTNFWRMSSSGPSGTLLYFTYNNSVKFKLDGTNSSFLSNASGRALELLNASSNRTIPVYSFAGDNNTGIGGVENEVSIIANGVEAIRATETKTTIKDTAKVDVIQFADNSTLSSANVSTVWTETQQVLDITSANITNGDSLTMVDDTLTATSLEFTLHLISGSTAYTDNTTDTVFIKTLAEGVEVKVGYFDNEAFTENWSAPKKSSGIVTTQITDGEVYWIDFPSGKLTAGDYVYKLTYKTLKYNW